MDLDTVEAPTTTRRGGHGARAPLIHRWPEAPRGRGQRGSPPHGRRAADPSISTGSAGGRTARRERGDAPGDEASGSPRSCRPWRSWGTDRAARGRRELLLVADGLAAQDAGRGAAEATADVLAARRSAGAVVTPGNALRARRPGARPRGA